VKIDQSQTHILVVDDEAPVRSMIQQGILRNGFTCATAPDGDAALEFLKSNPVDVVITDIIMPGINGMDLTRRIKASHDADVIIMTGYIEDYSYENIIDTGASDFIQKPMTLKEMTIRLQRVLRERMILKERERVEDELKRSLDQQRKANDGIVRAMATAVEARDPYTAGHQTRVAELGAAIGKTMGLDENRIQGLRMGGFIHDLGKISIPAEILTKPSKLTDLEFGIIKTHSQVGYDILKPIEFPWPVARMVLQHHERMNGTGYPQGLHDDEILLESRILAVADVVESMASHRPYRAALGVDIALEEISKNKVVLYDKEPVEACIHLLRDQNYVLD
jgi:response regulator RpfG family c-di-GMP phosphodiesterase